MYQNYSDEDLIEAYTTMVEYSGKPSDELMSAIEERGGIENFKKQIEIQNDHRIEERRITKEVYSLSDTETDVEFIKKLITSDVFSKEHLDRLIEVKFSEHQAILQNNVITSKTIIAGLAAAIFSSMIGAIILSLLTVFVTSVLFYFYIVIVYIVNYLIIKFITKQSRRNLAVFIISLLATIGSVTLGLYFSSLLFSQLANSPG